MVYNKYSLMWFSWKDTKRTTKDHHEG